mgnify:CR=1 FL=1
MQTQLSKHTLNHTQGLGERTTIRAVATRSATSDDGRVPVRNLQATIDSTQPTHQPANHDPPP